jgi:hypothetical protein
MREHAKVGCSLSDRAWPDGLFLHEWFLKVVEGKEVALQSNAAGQEQLA